MKVLNTVERKEYNKVTNAGIDCRKCGKPRGIEYIKIFKVKNYPAPEGFEGW